MTLLETKKLTKSFGGLVAVSEVDFHMASGEIVGLIGPNGAGKTTFFNVVSGVFKPTSGVVLFEGESITRLRPDQVVCRGLVRTFQAASVFPDLTTLENVVLGHHIVSKGGIYGALIRSTTCRRSERQIRENAREILRYLGLEGVRNEKASKLPYGFKKTLGIAIALAANPKLLLLDEPVAGMNTAESDAMMKLIRGLKDNRRLSVLIVEHDMKVVMGLCERIVVLNSGYKMAEGSPSEIAQNNSVIEAYLGKEDLAA